MPEPRDESEPSSGAERDGAVAAAVEPLYARLSTRVRALAVDMAVFAVALVAMMVLDTVVSSPTLARVNGVLFLGLLFLYEPLLVWRLGGTLGHIRQNLRVVSDRTGERPGLVASLVRWIVKGFFGLFSFLLMLLTNRHQALHDRASRTTVQVRHAGRARRVDFVAARAEPRPGAGVSAARRAVAIGIYGLLLFGALSVAGALLVTERCAAYARCSDVEEALLVGLGWVGLLGALAVVGLGWLGRLPGARAPRDSVVP